LSTGTRCFPERTYDGAVAALTIKESRKLVLPLDTVLEALLHFDGKSHGPLSRGDVLQAEMIRDDVNGDGIEVAVRTGAQHIVDWHRFNFSSIAAAIISYCRSKRIPLPYSGVKSLELTREGIAFHIENTVSISRKPAVREDLSGQVRYAKGYEPHAIQPNTNNEVYV
jgi:hypothetical protein